ncbi:hypothetical protein B0H34DRAFT_644725 [Crassisporium funariophilum]|nr:hypothetical protein B0H34DRAFT_644725 [Crassisporium funariophilum]
MDELINHCLRELAFDGDLGSNVSRLRDFIHEFYGQSGASHAQNPDNDFCSFVWSVIVQDPTVLVGLVPPGLTSQVWIAPQTSAKRKAKARGEEHIEMRPPKLDPIADSKGTSLEVLQKVHGDRLRIAVEPDVIFAAVTGSHIRSPKTSPMVYSALQIITRGRDAGVTVVELGKQSGYDQKTCFYLVRQLTELDLVIKVRRGGVGTHFCIHKHFFERNLSWKAIREEETLAETSQTNKRSSEPDFAEDDEVLQDTHALHFTPIDARHLSSLPLISARVVRLLQASKNHIHASNNMLIILGFSNPTKTDRRFFQSRIREMVQQRIIEKVIVPSNNKKRNATVKCFRLVEDAECEPVDGGIVISDLDDDVEDRHNGVKMNLTIHKQIISLLEDSGTSGMTLNDISFALCQFDKRTVELLLARADKSHPPSHLSDLRITGLMETSGRERRHRYYTVANYRRLLSDEELDRSYAGHNEVDLGDVGEFYEMSSPSFYESNEGLLRYQDSFKVSDKTPRIGKPRKRTPKNPVLHDGQTKRGRPRKSALPKQETLDNGDLQPERVKKRKKVSGSVNDGEAVDEPPVKKRAMRGRPPKKTKTRTPLNSDIVVPDEPAPSSTSKKTRGRPRLRPAPSEDPLENGLPPTPVNGMRHSMVSRDRTPDFEDGRIGDGTMPHGVVVDSTIMEIPDRTTPPQPVNSYSSSAIPESGPMQGDDCCAIDAVEMPDPLAMLQEISSLIEGKILDPSSSCTEPSSANISTSLPPGVRVNVSHLRRENELLRLVETFGGIANVQTKEFYEAHIRLLEFLTQSGEPTSAPVGTRTDKRTATATFDRLERKGRIKQLKTSVMTHTGVNRPACIVYLPNIEQEQINAFLADLARGTQPPVSQLSSFVKIPIAVEYGGQSSSTPRLTLPLQLLRLEKPGDNEKERWSKNVGRANQLFAHDDATIRDVFLAERTTVGQLYGFIVGKAMRCRELHLATLRTLEIGSASSFIVSKEKRIIDLSFFLHDLTLELHCSLISSLSHDEELTAFLASEQGRKTLVRDLPPRLHTLLQVGRSRARTRFLDLLEVLRSLNLVTPLQPLQSGDPFISCPPNGDYPVTFERVPHEGRAEYASFSAPIYFYFHEIVPVHIWAVSETQPPYWKTLAAVTHADGVLYWETLRDACTNPQLDISGYQLDQPRHVPIASLSAARSLRRPVSWNSHYFLTWHQTQYLKQFVDVSSASTPLQNSDTRKQQDLMEKLCWVTSAPGEAVANYFSTFRDKLLKDLDRMQRKAESHAKKRHKKSKETQFSLAKKAAEARMQLEQEWKTLLAKHHPETLTDVAAVRIHRIRIQFLQAGSTKDPKWDREIQAALREAELASAKILKLTTKGHLEPKATNKHLLVASGNTTSTPSSSTLSVETPIQTLIELQGPPIQHERIKGKRKRKQHDSYTGMSNSKTEAPKKAARRHRFQWNQDFDELARDASAIIRARCRNLPRLDWGAFEQVFPAVPRNTVRQRLSHIRETPGNETYLRRLEDSWYELWMKHRGTPVLPDDDVYSPSHFDLISHVKFLRTHIDKNALRVGFPQANELATHIIPSDIEMLHSTFDIVEAESTAPEWDFMWNAVVEEGREKKMKRLSISRCPKDSPPYRFPETDDMIIAEAALKMALGTPPESYKPEQASDLLRSRGEESISAAAKLMLSRGILSKSQRDPQRHKPGRQLKISENNQNAIGGNVSRDTFQDARSLLEEIDPNDDSWHDWPLTATDGDNATLIQLASENQVDFNIDTTLPRAARASLDWNSKKADDDQIETTISVRYRFLSEMRESFFESDLRSSPPISDPPALPCSPDVGYGHELAIGNTPACCRKMTSQGLVDCVACLADAWSAFSAVLTRDEFDDAQRILDAVRRGGDNGVKKADLLHSADPSTPRKSMIINQMIEEAIPQVYWAGYESLILVSAQHIAKWSVIVSKDPVLRIFPRRWLDIKGMKVVDFWQAALRAVMGTIVFRPGVTQVVQQKPLLVLP